LLATDELVYPFVVLSFLLLVVLELIPDIFEGQNVYFDFVAEFINESK
jgi:hypothetical protein